MDNKLTEEQLERLEKLEVLLKACLYDIAALREDGENEYLTVEGCVKDAMAALVAA